MSSIEKVLENYRAVVKGEIDLKVAPRFSRYAVTNLRGGVGKTSIAFNLAYALSRVKSLLVLDVCPQCNLTESLMRDERPTATVQSALQPRVLGPAFGQEPDELGCRISECCFYFQGGKKSYIIPGSPDLFGFPSALYGQLQLASVQATDASSRVARLLLSLKSLADHYAADLGCDVTLMDTSPFYSGGTHLAWCAAESLVIPVRVDEHSIESLKLTFDMLSNQSKDFLLWNSRAGIKTGPKISAIVMTMVGSKSQQEATPDRASRMFIERALNAAEEYPQLFHAAEPADAFALADDFHSSGRISGAKSIPIAKLQVGQFFRVDGKRLEVNKSAERYQRQLAFLASLL